MYIDNLVDIYIKLTFGYLVIYFSNKCSDTGMEVNFPALLGNYDKSTERRTAGLRGKLQS